MQTLRRGRIVSHSFSEQNYKSLSFFNIFCPYRYIFLLFFGWLYVLSPAEAAQSSTPPPPLSATPTNPEFTVSDVVGDNSAGKWFEDIGASQTVVPGSMQIELTCDNFSLVELTNGEYSIEALSLFASGDSGNPALPGRLLRFALPPDTNLSSVTMEILSSRITLVPGTYNIAPVPMSAAAIMGQTFFDTTGTYIVNGRNSLVYGSDKYYDQEFCTFVSVQQMGRWKVVEVFYSPFSYNPSTGSVSVVKETSVVLNYEGGNALPADLEAKTGLDVRASELLVNFDQGRQWYVSAISNDATIPPGPRKQVLR